MRIEVENYTAQVVHNEERQRRIIITSDGRKWDFSDKERAEAYEIKLKAFQEFKDSIQYREVDVEDERYASYNDFDRAFTFTITEPTDVRADAWCELQGLKYCVIQPGKYLVIQYYDDMGDGPVSYYGFFGLVSDYIEQLESRINDLNILKDKVTKLLP